MNFWSCYAAMARTKVDRENWQRANENQKFDEKNRNITNFLIEEIIQTKESAFTASQLHSRLVGIALIGNIAAISLHVEHPNGGKSIQVHRIFENDVRELQLLSHIVSREVVINAKFAAALTFLTLISGQGDYPRTCHRIFITLRPWTHRSRYLWPFKSP